jgi:Fe-S cluster biogenesis protein NfuA
MTMSILDTIETILNEDVRPDLLKHQGNVVVVSYEKGILRIRLTGKCSGCPSASLTAEELIGERVKARLPEVQDVILVSGVSDDLIAQAKAILSHDFPL